MLLKIIDLFSNESKSEFDEVIKTIEHSFYPVISDNDITELKEDFEKKTTNKQEDQPYPEELLTQLNDSIKKKLQNYTECYQVFINCPPHKSISSRKFNLPFSEEYFKFFAQRKNTSQYTPTCFLVDEAINIFPKSEGNCPKNLGDYNHFNNVVLAIARLINYFRNIEHINDLFQESIKNTSLLEHLVYPDKEETQTDAASKRSFLLMLSAYYHDLGKTIVYPRHAIEGSVILESHNTSTLFAFNKIAKEYEFKSFTHEDLFFVSHLVYYHDQFGTLGTGEAGYLRLADLIHRLKTDCTKNKGKPSIEQNKISAAKNLFDLWVLNIADMMVSVQCVFEDKNQIKNESQKECLGDSHKSSKRIKEFLEKRDESIHDFCIMIDLLEDFARHRHTDDLLRLEETCTAYARRHTIERIRRLLRALLVDTIPELERSSHSPNDDPVLKLLKKIKDLEYRDWHELILRAIKSVSDPSEFANRFAWVGQMDYSFSFFNKVKERALESIKDCILNPSATTYQGRGWYYEDMSTDGKSNQKYDDDFLLRTNAVIFAENLASVIVQIIHHLLFREKEFDRLINFEFTDARNRLTDEKINRIIGLQGPNREKRAIQLSLEGIFFFN